MSARYVALVVCVGCGAKPAGPVEPAGVGPEAPGWAFPCSGDFGTVGVTWTLADEAQPSASVDGGGAQIVLAPGSYESAPIKESSNGILSLVLRRHPGGAIELQCVYDLGNPLEGKCKPFKSQHTLAAPFEPWFSDSKLFWASPLHEDLPADGGYYTTGAVQVVIEESEDMDHHPTVWMDVTYRVDVSYASIAQLKQTMTKGPIANLALISYDRNGLPPPSDFGGSYDTGLGQLVVQQEGDVLTGTIDAGALYAEPASQIALTGGVFSDVAILQWQSASGPRYLIAKMSPDRSQVFACNQHDATRVLANRTP